MIKQLSIVLLTGLIVYVIYTQTKKTETKKTELYTPSFKTLKYSDENIYGDSYIIKNVSGIYSLKLEDGVYGEIMFIVVGNITDSSVKIFIKDYTAVSANQVRIFEVNTLPIVSNIEIFKNITQQKQLLNVNITEDLVVKNFEVNGKPFDKKHELPSYELKKNYPIVLN